jgi:hypothetical protein
MPYPGMLHRVALVRTDVSEERIASINRATIIGELKKLIVTRNRGTLHILQRLRVLVTTNVVPGSPIFVTLMVAIRSSETSVLTKPQVATSQKMTFFIVTVVKASNPKTDLYIFRITGVPDFVPRPEF